MTRKETQPKPLAAPTEAATDVPVDARGQPLNAYPGWDAAEGVFRLDCSLPELEDRYRRHYGAQPPEAETGTTPRAETGTAGLDQAQPPPVAPVHQRRR
jgi:hypothetical protein